MHHVISAIGVDRVVIPVCSDDISARGALDRAVTVRATANPGCRVGHREGDRRGGGFTMLVGDSVGERIGC